ncbi:HAD family hydrolase [Flammeovirga pectinis]|uniref:HAD family hydrolase n=1 Tax=Flammeovirga pectinis TaxID=2494373 RepID=UPI001476A201|nr:HAD family hydrolase [Flammeovirga pectinis]
MKKNNLIVFDIDGTLTESVQVHQKGFIHSLKQLGVQNIDSNFKEYKHHTDSFIAKKIYESDKKEAFSKSIIEEFEQLLSNFIKTKSITEIAGAQKTVEYIEKHTDFGVCYATGSLLIPAMFKLDSIGLKYNNEQLTASNTIEDRESIVLQAIESAKSFYQTEKFDRIISVGDGLWDLKTALNLNLEFIGIGLKNKKVLIENGMTVYFDNLTNFKIEKKVFNKV